MTGFCHLPKPAHQREPEKGQSLQPHEVIQEALPVVNHNPKIHQTKML